MVISSAMLLPSLQIRYTLQTLQEIPTFSREKKTLGKLSEFCIGQ